MYEIKDSSGAVLYRSNKANILRDALMDACHEGVDLSGARISCMLVGSPMSRVHLTRARLSHADLRGMDFADAVLTDCDFSNADLRGANFSLVTIRGGIDLRGANMEGVKGWPRP